MNHLKTIYYLDRKPLIKTNSNVGCHFCGRVEACYYNESYYTDDRKDAYRKICHHAYKELCDFPVQMTLVYHSLSDHLVMDVVRIILFNVYHLTNGSKCVDLKKREDDYLCIIYYNLTNNEIKILFDQRGLYNPYSGTRHHWINALEKDIVAKRELWRGQYQIKYFYTK